MKNYFIALKPFLIIALLRLISYHFGPVLIALGIRLNKPELFLENLPYIQMVRAIIGLVTVFIIIWVGYRISKKIFSSIWLSATAGIFYYVFSLVLAFFVVCFTPVVQASLSALILWIPFEMNTGIPFHALKGFFTAKTPIDILLNSGYGLMGGLIYLIQKNRKRKRLQTSDA